jgi:hypothetical protein
LPETSRIRFPHRNIHQKREPNGVVIALGIFNLALGSVVSIVRHSFYAGRFGFSLGLACVFVGVTEWVLRESMWRWATRLVGLVMWTAAFYMTLRS